MALLEPIVGQITIKHIPQQIGKYDPDKSLFGKPTIWNLGTSENYKFWKI